MKLPKRGSSGLSGSGPSEVFVSNSQDKGEAEDLRGDEAPVAGGQCASGTGREGVRVSSEGRKPGGRRPRCEAKVE
jgi:hypothetical protein